MMVSIFTDLNGVRSVIEKMQDGEYLVPALLAESITLLALAIRSLALCFSPEKDAKE
jgi:hypothetical protein